MEKNWLVITGYFFNLVIVSTHATKAQADKAVKKYVRQDNKHSLLFCSEHDYNVVTRQQYDAAIKKEEKLSQWNGDMTTVENYL